MLAVAGMPLVSPIAWAYYFVLLALPLLLLWKRLASAWARIILWTAVVLLLVPEGLYPGLYKKFVPNSADVSHLANHLPTPPDFGLCAIGLGPANPGTGRDLPFGRLRPVRFRPVEATGAGS